MSHKDEDIQITRRRFLAAGMAASLSSFNILVCNYEKDILPNILVFMPDSWRGDHVGVRGYGRPVCPEIDTFASTSCYYFRNAYSQSTATKQSVASLFTGVMPSVHLAGLQPNTYTVSIDSDEQADFTTRTQTIRSQFKTLAECLSSCGYHTSWISANPVVNDAPTFERGFDTVITTGPERKLEQMEEVDRWLSESAQEPFFTFIHVYDPHFPYLEHFPYSATGKCFGDLFGEDVFELIDGLPQPDKTILRLYLEAHKESKDKYGNPLELAQLSKQGLSVVQKLYDAEIRSVDERFGRILARLKSTRVLDRTLVIVLSDHGQSFSDHGVFYHGHSPFYHQIHVPLLIHLPGQSAPTTVTHPVSTYDVFPTLLTLARGSIPDYVQAQTLFSPTGQLSVSGDRIVMAEADMRRLKPREWDVTVIQADTKVNEFQALGAPCVHDDKDEDAKRPCSSDSGIRHMKTLLKQKKAENVALAKAFGEPEWVSISKETVDVLEAIGYL
ncbi:MAG TPA: sulfatase [Candidatus Hydrogenedentes bacterium]|nr:sulfatase [Candidatus Hydrogenedentota bacterium]